MATADEVVRLFLGAQMKEDQLEQFSEFSFVEYREAANAYFNGVDIGYTTVKHYITINALFVALLGALWEHKDEALAPVGGIMKIVPWIAVIISIALFGSLRHYFRHLENCRARCQEIEHSYGGKLFTKLGRIANHKTSFNTVHGLTLIIGLVVVFWVCVAFKM